jgi:UDP-N-acetylglucosamine 2-epimerase (non-hydrolysing)
MKRRTVWCVFGTRPEVIKMAPVVRALRARSDAVTVRLVFTGQHRDLARELFTPLAMTPDIALDVMTEDQSLPAVGARCLQAIAHALEQDTPALILVQGDTSTVLFSALAAYFHRIPIGHVEAGLRSFNKYAPFPEESMRRLTDAIADLHFAATPRAAANLRTEGVNPATVFVTGNTVIDAVQHAAAFGEREVSSHVRDWVRAGGPYVVTTLHRRESFGEDLHRILSGLAAFARAHPEVRTILPVHPNPNVGESVRRFLAGLPNVRLVNPLGYFDMVHLLVHCTTILTDSGGIQEEAPALGKRVLVARRITERPEGVDAGVARLVGADGDEIAKALHEELIRVEEPGDTAVPCPYGDGMAGERIADIVTHCLSSRPRTTSDWSGQSLLTFATAPS